MVYIHNVSFEVYMNQVALKTTLIFQTVEANSKLYYKPKSIRALSTVHNILHL